MTGVARPRKSKHEKERGMSPLPRKREKNRERERQLKREVLLGVMVVVFVGRRTSIIGKDRKDRSFQ